MNFLDIMLFQKLAQEKRLKLLRNEVNISLSNTDEETEEVKRMWMWTMAEGIREETRRETRDEYLIVNTHKCCV